MIILYDAGKPRRLPTWVSARFCGSTEERPDDPVGRETARDHGEGWDRSHVSLGPVMAGSWRLPRELSCLY